MQQIPPQREKFLNVEPKKQDEVNKLIASLSSIAFAEGFVKMDQTSTKVKYNSTGNKGNSSAPPPVNNNKKGEAKAAATTQG
jgi:hypothetical protein